MLNIAFTLGIEEYGSLLIIAGVFVLLYFFMIRPQKKQQQRDDEMRNALQVGDEVTTIGGIIGKVISIKAETFVLETTKDKTKIRFLKGAIRSVDVKAADIAAQVMEAAQPSDDLLDDPDFLVDVETAVPELSEAANDKAAAKKAKKEEKEKKKAEKKANSSSKDKAKKNKNKNKDKYKDKQKHK